MEQGKKISVTPTQRVYLPRKNGNFFGRETFLSEIDERLKANKNVAITGLGGIGKTQVVKHYAHTTDYDFRWWINTETGLHQDYEAMAKALLIETKNLSFNELKNKVKIALEEADFSWLLLFDNLDDFFEFEKYLPDSKKEKQHILITSRIDDFSETFEISPIKLTVFDRYESLELIYWNIFNKKKPIKLSFKDWEVELAAKVGELTYLKYKQEADALAEMLGDLPLALKQAIRLIAETGMGIPAYLEEFKKVRIELFKIRAPEDYAIPITEEMFSDLKDESRSVFAQDILIWLMDSNYLDSKGFITKNFDRASKKLPLIHQNAALAPLERKIFDVLYKLDRTTIATTLLITIERVGQENTTSLDIMRYISFISPDKIEKRFINNLLDIKNEMQCHFAIGILKKYSLIDVDHDFISIHRISQEVVLSIMQRNEMLQVALHLQRTLMSKIKFRRNNVSMGAYDKNVVMHGFYLVNRVLQGVVDLNNIVELVCIIGGILHEMGQNKDGLSLVEDFAKKIKNTDPFYSSLLYETGQMQYPLNHIDKAVSSIIEAIKFLPIHDQRSLFFFKSTLAYMYMEQGNSKAARAEIDSAAQILEAYPIENCIEIALFYNEQGFICLDLGECENAKEKFIIASRMLDELGISSSQQIHGYIFNGLGRAYQDIGSFDEAEKSYYKSIQHYENVYNNPAHYYIGIVHTNLANLYLSFDKIDESEKSLSSSFFVYKSFSYKSSYLLLANLIKIQILLRKNKIDDAYKIYDELAIDIKEYSPVKPAVKGQFYIVSTMISIKKNDFNSADSFLTEAERIFNDVYANALNHKIFSKLKRLREELHLIKKGVSMDRRIEGGTASSNANSSASSAELSQAVFGKALMNRDSFQAFSLSSFHEANLATSTDPSYRLFKMIMLGKPTSEISAEITAERGLLAKRDILGNVPAHIAAIQGRVEVLKMFTLFYHDILNSNNRLGLYPLHYSILKKDKESIAYILSKLGNGARDYLTNRVSITYINERKKTIIVKPNFLDWALLFGDEETVEMFLAKINLSEPSESEDVVDGSGFGTIIHMVIRRNSMKLLHQLLQYPWIKALINKKEDEMGLTPLSLAVLLNYFEVAQFLISRCDVEINFISTKQGWNALHWAIWKLQIQAVIFLMVNGAGIDLPTKATGKDRFASRQPAALADYRRDTINGKLETNQSDPSVEWRRKLEGKLADIESIQGIIVAPNTTNPHFRTVRHFVSPRERIYTNLVLNGGGAKGLLFPYAFKHLQKELSDKFELKNIYRVCGTSAGSIAILFLGLGDDANGLQNALSSLDVDVVIFESKKNDPIPDAMSNQDGAGWNFSTFFSHAKSTLGAVYDKLTHNMLTQLGDGIMSFAFDQGILSGDNFLEWLEASIEKRLQEKEVYQKGTWDGLITFRQWNALVNTRLGKGFKHLYITVTQLNPELKTITLNTEFIEEWWADIPIADAVRASMSIPVVFKPFQMRKRDAHHQPKDWVRTESMFVDGGLLCNYPLHTFDQAHYTENALRRFGQRSLGAQTCVNHRTLGLCLMSETPAEPLKQPRSIKQLAARLCSLYYNNEFLSNFRKEDDEPRTIYLPCSEEIEENGRKIKKEISTLDFKKVEMEDYKACADRWSGSGVKDFMDRHNKAYEDNVILRQHRLGHFT